jgi:addiction module RelE/StbE family toxin
VALELRATSAFERDLMICSSSSIRFLRAAAPHPLRGEWSGHWDCHIEPDWLLLYKITETELILVRTGSHAELFE